MTGILAITLQKSGLPGRDAFVARVEAHLLTTEPPARVEKLLKGLRGVDRPDPST